MDRPCALPWTLAHLELEGEALRDQVTGHCQKAYTQAGNWTQDNYDIDEDVPTLDTMEVNKADSAPLLLAGYNADWPDFADYNRAGHYAYALNESTRGDNGASARYAAARSLREEMAQWKPEVYYPSKTGEAAFIPPKMLCHFPVRHTPLFPSGLRTSFTPDDMNELEDEQAAYLLAKGQGTLQDELEAAGSPDNASWREQMSQFQSDWGRTDNWADSDDEDDEALPVPVSSTSATVEMAADHTGGHHDVETGVVADVTEFPPVAQAPHDDQPAVIETGNLEMNTEGITEEVIPDALNIQPESPCESVHPSNEVAEGSELVIAPVSRVRKSSSFSQIEDQLRSVSSSTTRASSSSSSPMRNSDTDLEDHAIDLPKFEDEEVADGNESSDLPQVDENAQDSDIEETIEDNAIEHTEVAPRTHGLPRSTHVTFPDFLESASHSSAKIPASPARITGVLPVGPDIDPLPRSPNHVDKSALAPGSSYGLSEIEEEAEEDLLAVESASSIVSQAEQLRIVETEVSGPSSRHYLPIDRNRRLAHRYSPVFGSIGEEDATESGTEGELRRAGLRVSEPEPVSELESELQAEAVPETEGLNEVEVLSESSEVSQLEQFSEPAACSDLEAPVASEPLSPYKWLASSVMQSGRKLQLARAKVQELAEETKAARAKAIASFYPQQPSAHPRHEEFAGPSELKGRQARLDSYKPQMLTDQDRNATEEEDPVEDSKSIHSREMDEYDDIHPSMIERPSAPAPGDDHATFDVPDSPVRKSPLPVKSLPPASTIRLVPAEAPLLQPVSRVRVTFAETTKFAESSPIMPSSPTRRNSPPPSTETLIPSESTSSIFLMTPTGIDIPISEATLATSMPPSPSEASTALEEVLSTPWPPSTPFTIAKDKKPSLARRIKNSFCCTSADEEDDETEPVKSGWEARPKGTRRGQAKKVVKVLWEGFLKAGAYQTQYHYVKYS